MVGETRFMSALLVSQVNSGIIDDPLDEFWVKSQMYLCVTSKCSSCPRGIWEEIFLDTCDFLHNYKE